MRIGEHYHFGDERHTRNELSSFIDAVHGLVVREPVLASFDEGRYTVDVDAWLVPPGRIAGRVRFASGRAASINFSLHADDSPFQTLDPLDSYTWSETGGTHSVTSEVDGSFVFEMLNPGCRYDLEVVEPETGARILDVAVGTLDVDLVIDDDLVGPMVLKGDVTRAADGSPVPAYQVHAVVMTDTGLYYGTDYDSEIDLQVVAADGRFRFEVGDELSAQASSGGGSLICVFSAPGLQTVTVGPLQRADLLPEVLVALPDLVKPVIEVVDLTGSPVLDANVHTFVAGPRGPGTAPVYSGPADPVDSRGRLVLDPLTWEVVAIHAHGAAGDGYVSVDPHALPDSLSLIVQPEQEPATATLLISNGRGQPLSDTVIQCRRLCPSDVEVVFEARSDEQGEVVLGEHPAGTYMFAVAGSIFPVRSDLSPGANRLHIRFW